MPENRHFLRIAHRGASGYCPENTRAAFARALELGARMVEVDGQLSRDGSVVLIHDETLERTTSGAGPVASRMLAELRSLDAGSWFSPEFASETIPTLEEAVVALKGGASLNLELKGDGAPGPLEARCLAVLGDLGFLDETVFSSFSLGRTRRLRELSRGARLAVLIDEGGSWDEALALAREIGAEAVHPERSLALPEAIARAHGEGYLVRVWPVNDPAEAARLVEIGVDGIFTDFPDRL